MLFRNLLFFPLIQSFIISFGKNIKFLYKYLLHSMLSKIKIFLWILLPGKGYLIYFIFLMTYLKLADRE